MNLYITLLININSKINSINTTKFFYKFLLLIGIYFSCICSSKAVVHSIYSTNFDDTIAPTIIELYRFEDQSLFGCLSVDEFLHGNDSECLQFVQGANLNDDRDFYAKWKLEPQSNGVIIAKRKFFYKDSIDIITLRLISSENLSDLKKDDLIRNVQKKGAPILMRYRHFINKR